MVGKIKKTDIAAVSVGIVGAALVATGIVALALKYLAPTKAPALLLKTAFLATTLSTGTPLTIAALITPIASRIFKNTKTSQPPSKNIKQNKPQAAPAPVSNQNPPQAAPAPVSNQNPPQATPAPISNQNPPQATPAPISNNIKKFADFLVSKNATPQENIDEWNIDPTITEMEEAKEVSANSLIVDWSRTTIKPILIENGEETEVSEDPKQAFFQIRGFIDNGNYSKEELDSITLQIMLQCAQGNRRCLFDEIKHRSAYGKQETTLRLEKDDHYEVILSVTLSMKKQVWEDSNDITGAPDMTVELYNRLPPSQSVGTRFYFLSPSIHNLHQLATDLVPYAPTEANPTIKISNEFIQAHHMHALGINSFVRDWKNYGGSSVELPPTQNNIDSSNKNYIVISDELLDDNERASSAFQQIYNALKGILPKDQDDNTIKQLTFAAMLWCCQGIDSDFLEDLRKFDPLNETMKPTRTFALRKSDGQVWMERTIVLERLDYDILGRDRENPNTGSKYTEEEWNRLPKKVQGTYKFPLYGFDHAMTSSSLCLNEPTILIDGRPPQANNNNNNNA